MGLEMGTPEIETSEDGFHDQIPWIIVCSLQIAAIQWVGVVPVLCLAGQRVQHMSKLGTVQPTRAKYVPCFKHIYIYI